MHNLVHMVLQTACAQVLACMACAWAANTYDGMLALMLCW